MRITALLGLSLALAALSAAASADPKTPSEIYDENRPGVVHIAIKPAPDVGGEEITGTGFIIAPEGYVLTADHILGAYVDAVTTPIRVRLGSLTGKEVKADPVLRGRPDLDVALLKLQLPGSVGLEDYPVVPRGNSAALAAGSPVDVIGFNLTSNIGVVPASVATNLPGGVGGERLWSLNAAGVIYGMSGAPVFDTEGGVIGIIKGGIANTIAYMYPERLLDTYAALEPLPDAHAVIPLWKRQVPPAPESDAPGIPVETAADALSSGDGNAGQQIAYDFGHDVYEVVYGRYPITGDPETTASIHLNQLDIAFLQGRRDLIKLEKFSITPGARQLRTPSHGYSETSPTYVADAWAYLRDASGFTPIAPVHIASKVYWPLAPADTTRDLYLLAYYNRTRLLVGQKGYAGIKVADVAGTVDVVNFFIGGALRSMQLGDIYLVKPTQPPTLLLAATANVAAMADPRGELVKDFRGLIENLRRTSAASGGKEFDKLLRVWEEATGSSSHWAAGRLQHARRDVFVTYRGGP